MLTRNNAIGFLLRGPAAVRSRTARLAILALTAAGAGFLIWSGVIHLELWGDGYKDISVIGPLFLVQGIACIVIAVAVVALRWLVLLLAGVVAGVATAVGLLLTATVGLFGYTESLTTPYADLSLAVEFTAAFLFLVAVAVLGAGARTRATATPAPVPSRL
ncbi:MAG TPA: hypothetical protein VHF26_10380 [Trebonia sp.]|nr:hypothetical protein [Trebonia sp.]